MSGKKQTAVEWLIEQINQDYPEMTWAYKNECEQAKAMEKEQIEMSYKAGYNDCSWSRYAGSEKYYTSTYGQ